MKRKLIEVALPLEAINRESAREKSIRHGHPSTLHLWWARRPLAAARAVLFAQLVDDPSSHPDKFPTEEDQRRERERLHGIIERLVVWENIRDERLLEEARQEILKSTDGNPPPILDPFAGGGTIPLEAQRLGLEAHASDLNPVAVLINKALIEIPPKFRDQPPVFPGLAESEVRTWRGAEGLAADVRAYGTWVREEAQRRIGHIYPKIVLPDRSAATVIAWIWARSVTCPNPACRIEMPLVRSWWLAKKKGKEAFVVPLVITDSTHPSGLCVKFEVSSDPANAPNAANDGTVQRTGAVCVSCDASVPLPYIRAEGKAGRLRHQLMAVVAEGKRQRNYLAPDSAQLAAVAVEPPNDIFDANLPSQALGFRVQAYGLTHWRDLYTNRQLVALATLSDLTREARSQIREDAATAGLQSGRGIESGSITAEAYAEAVTTYLALIQSKLTNLSSTLTSWMSDRGAFRETFARQALSMVWDFAETNPLSEYGGGWGTILEKEARVLESLPLGAPLAKVRQADAAVHDFAGMVLSTDPPYYDNIGYADLSDFFYVWLRRSQHDVHERLFGTVLVPKAEELVANPFRHGGASGAKAFFEDGFREVFARARSATSSIAPHTVYYAFKQSETGEDGRSSSGWETLLDGMIRAGWSVTATWPIRTEGSGRLRNLSSNALASSIVLALRPREPDAPTADRRGLIAALRSELPGALRRLQQGQIAPVDLPQAAIGPGMAVFSRYSKVLEPDGSPMTVRSALLRINEILDEVLAEQEGDFDATTRFAIAWYRQHGYGTGKFGDADNLARARNTSVDAMDRAGILTGVAGKVTLLKPADTPSDYDVLTDEHVSAWEVLHHSIRILESEGVPAAGAFLAAAQGRRDGAVDTDLVKELAFLLFPVAEKNGWTKDAISFNAVAQSWSDVIDASKTAAPTDVQEELDYTGDEDY